MCPLVELACPALVFGCHVIAVGGTMLCGTGAQGACQILNLFSTCLPRNLSAEGISCVPAYLKREIVELSGERYNKLDKKAKGR